MHLWQTKEGETQETKTEREKMAWVHYREKDGSAKLKCVCENGGRIRKFPKKWEMSQFKDPIRPRKDCQMIGLLQN